MKIEKDINGFTIWMNNDKYCINLHSYNKYWEKPRFSIHENGGRKKN